uniref:Type IV pilus assembly PilZ n=1 Tax=Rhodopseudomonas palustris (strain BisA53) TaxID=316055 RepID=Q07SL0_RHOP5
MIERRQSERTLSNYQSYVRVIETDSFIDCNVLDISETGVRLSVARPVPKEASIELHIPAKGQVIQSKVVWSTGSEVGVAFQSTYDVQQVARALLRFASEP